MVLPLLPADYMAPGLNALRKWATEKKIFTPQMSTMCAYIEQHWLRAIGADKMSVFGLPHSIYNSVQMFNKDLRASFDAAHSTIWNLLGKALPIFQLDIYKHFSVKYFRPKNERTPIRYNINFLLSFRMFNLRGNAHLCQSEETKKGNGRWCVVIVVGNDDFGRPISRG